MRVKTSISCTLILVTVGVNLISGCATSSSYDGPCPGDIRYVSTESIALRSAPDDLSRQVKELSYKDVVTVKEVVRVAPPFAGDKATFPENLIPCWLKVSSSGTEGYLPVGVLASDWLMANQNPNERITNEGMIVAKRGFSEDEEMEMATMRGAAGKGNFLANADYTALEVMYQEQRKHPVSQEELVGFIEAGTFSANPIKPEKLDVEEKGAFSKFGSSSRQIFANAIDKASDVAGQRNGEEAKLISATGKVGAGFVYSESGPVQEFQVGESVAAKVLPAYKMVPMNDPRTTYVRTMANMLARASNNPMPYRGLMVILCDSTEVNAFAIPGGYLIVTTGMLDFLKDEDELAAIIGHEIGHLELQHGMRAVGTEKILKLFSLLKEVGASKAKDDNLLVDQLKGMVDDIFGKMYESVRNGYGVEIESQADWRSLQLCNRLGYDTKALYDVLERFKVVKGTYGGASYPAERGSDILKYRSQLGYVNDAPAHGRDVRTARYKAAVGK